MSVREGRPLSRRCHSWGSGSQRAKSASVREMGVFSLSEFEVETGAGGFDVGEAGGGAGLLLGGGRGLNMGGVDEDAFDVPLPAARCTRLTLVWSVKLMVENSTRRRQRELMRSVARTEVARMTGSEPNAGSSSTTKFSRVKPGSGKEGEVDRVEMDGAAEAVADAAGDAVPEAVDVDQRREQDHQERKKSARAMKKRRRRARGERRGDAPPAGRPLVGGVDLLHERLSGAVTLRGDDLLFINEMEGALPACLVEDVDENVAMKPMRSPMLCLLIWSAGVSKDQ